MKENPYSKMIEIMKNQGTKSNNPLIAIVIESPPNLVIKINDLQIDKVNILIADYLLSGYKRNIRIPEVSATGETNETNTHKHSINKIGINNMETTFLDTLKKGDKLAVLPTDDKQTYIVLCRVVSL